ncbi:hypothetical protein [Deinococcus peraridilitoris]|uniref:Outer membrane protein beta-barrel domain-containing protein n=1 Tax=Deinococcus peraridilitoris (strain DSM 19664 / LMG 22246 / CIP 109416 / KR-200) TaxID=937777 RepID=K9ZZ22_DEIPD|nr:hypothetical protein [Deinococcus peraridilitoris]AFZ66005.1 hypothetical protein Deipe_0405 [Deinococcus peraridilitoris DSM 19664]
MSTLPKRILALFGLLAVAPASLAGGWAAVGVSTTGVGVQAGFGLAALPFIGRLGLEAALERPFTTSAPTYSLGATLRDVNLPATGIDAFVGAGLEWSPTPNPYVEAGLRAPLFGPLGLKATVRTAAGTGRATLGAEVRF